MTNNPNVPDKSGRTPIHWAACNGHTEIVKILVPLTDNPNAPNDCGKTPIHWAARTGHTEIVKILAPLKNNTNAPKSRRNTLGIYWTAWAYEKCQNLSLEDGLSFWILEGDNFFIY